MKRAVPHRLGLLSSHTPRAELVRLADLAAHTLREAAAAWVAATAAGAAQAARRPFDVEDCREAAVRALALDAQLQEAARRYAFAVDAIAHQARHGLGVVE